MISCENFFKILEENKLTFFTGVPDSTFKDWMSFMEEKNGVGLTNIIACNECEAVAIAAGYNLSTRNIGVVYMQNSGEGKAVNPLTSLCDTEVYSIPELLMIGWRGQPGENDEPQHKKMGKITLGLLDTLGVPYIILSDDKTEIEKQILKAKIMAESQSRSVAIIIKSGLFEEYICKKEDKLWEMSREDAIKLIVDNLNGDEIIISTTGKTSRELFEYRNICKKETADFYTVGSMGCSSSMANSIAMQKPQKRVVVFDGDGAVLMQMGSLATIGFYKPKNFLHIIFDNQSYDSTGGQKTVSSSIDFCKVAIACGYNYSKEILYREDLVKELCNINKISGPSMIVIKINKGSRKNLGRPTKTPLENKESFMKYLES